jgi:Ca-activated chloride channel homolog
LHWRRAGGIVKVLACSVLVLAATVVVVAQQAPAPTLPPVANPSFTTSTSLVALNVSVVDKQSRYVTGLQPTDFTVFEDGIPQNVRFFESHSVPVDLIVLLDASASMGDKLPVVHEAAIGFLKTLRDRDRGAIVSFDDSVRVLEPLTSDRGALERAIQTTGAHGSTALNNAIYISLKQFGQLAQHNAEVRRQAIAVLTDGEDTSSMVSFDDVLALARRSGVSIYMVGLQSPNAEAFATDPHHRFQTQSDFALKTLAHETGAQAFFPSQVTQLKGIYSSIAEELANQYSIGYVPANTSAASAFRRITVRLLSHPELTLRTRAGYTSGD